MSKEDLWNILTAHKTLVPRRKRRHPEAAVQSDIVAWLMTHGVLVGVTDAGLLNKMGLGMSSPLPAGWPDLTCCTPNGYFLAVECKSAKGKQDPEQVKIQAHIEARHGVYILAHSLEELIDALRKEEKVNRFLGFDLDE